MISKCTVHAALKPRFYKPPTGRLIKATQSFERLSMDFKGPLPTRTRNRYLLTVVNEHSRFTFALACLHLLTTTILNCLCQLFVVFGMPAYIHTDRGSSFMFAELSKFLLDKWVATSHTTAHKPMAKWNVLTEPFGIPSHSLYEPETWHLLSGSLPFMTRYIPSVRCFVLLQTLLLMNVSFVLLDGQLTEFPFHP
ncbi:unnamed protein product, partial [Dicrocoelium dendriticum]